jgi:hypothetical protein
MRNFLGYTSIMKKYTAVEIYDLRLISKPFFSRYRNTSHEIAEVISTIDKQTGMLGVGI